MNREDCRSMAYPHNHRCRFTGGFYCRDCSTFFGLDTEDYIRTERVVEIYLSCRNLRAFYIQKSLDVPSSLSMMIDRLSAHMTPNPFSMPLEEVKRLISDALAVINEHSQYSKNLHSAVLKRGVSQ